MIPVIGFPVPYVGILSEKGSFSTTITPMLDLKYDQAITSFDLGVIGCNDYGKNNATSFGGSAWAGMNNLGSGWAEDKANIIICPDKNEIFFLYPAKNKPGIQFDIQNDKDSVLKKSDKPPYTSAGKNL